MIATAIGGIEGLWLQYEFLSYFYLMLAAPWMAVVFCRWIDPPFWLKRKQLIKLEWIVMKFGF